MPNPKNYIHLRLELLEARENPSGALPTATFDNATIPALPVGWAQWSSNGAADVATAAGVGVGGMTGATTSGASNTTALAWNTQAFDPNTGASVAVYASSAVPAVLFTRGEALGTSTPSYLGAVVTRGLTVELLQVSQGQTQVLGTIKSPNAVYVSDRWVSVTLIPTGTTASVTVVRQDTGQYLNAQGAWQTAAISALTATVAAPTGNGVVGFGRLAEYAGAVNYDNFTELVPSVAQNFDSVPVAAMPSGWAGWSSIPSAAFQTSAPLGGDATNGFTSNAALSTAGARAWTTSDLTANVDASASVYLNSLIPAQVFARGSELATTTPTYYAVNVVRGLQAQIVAVVDGVSTTLATVKSSSYFTDQWVNVRLTANGTQLQAMIERTDTGQWLTASGAWSNTPCCALQAADGSIAADGEVGLGRAVSYTGALTFDNFNAEPLADEDPPQAAVAATGTMVSGGYTGNVTFQAAAAPGMAAIVQIQFQLNGVVQTTWAANASWTLNTATLANGSYILLVEALDARDDIGTTRFPFTVNNPFASPPTVPTAPQHYPNIRIAELAYSGTPMNNTVTTLLQNSVDLVVSNPEYFQTIDAVAPNTPQLIYTNLSNLYGGLLTSWLQYAEANGISPEVAFYHVAQATPFSGSSPSSQPVDWFWSVYETAALAGGAATDFTSAAVGGSSSTGINMGAAGQSLNIGYPDPFAEINVALTTPAAAGWSGVWQYASKGANGQIVWKTLPLLQDGTTGMTKSGTITFDPPSDWVPSSATASAPAYYYVRFQVTHGTASQAAVAGSILADDYVHANGGTSGVVPAFDYAADTNHDGYLDAAEYANRAPGKNAQFAYQSRLFYPYYGQERYVTNPSSPALQAWAASYEAQNLSANPLASGLFIDNSSGKLPFTGTTVLESTANYSIAFGNMVQAVRNAVGSKSVVTNGSGGNPASLAAVAQASTAVYEESLLRPETVTWSGVGDTANIINSLLYTDKTPYVIIDSSAVGGSPTDPQTQIATLAYYYLLGDPTRTFLDFYGGDSPATSWTQHWSLAAAVNIGQPTGAMSVFASGKDPANAALTYEVYSRNYSNGLVLFKPLSYSQGAGTGTLNANTTTSIALGGNYYMVNADGSIGTKVVSSISLANGQGAILIKA